MHQLNFDVWLEIIAFLFDPRDILSLRMTSSTLHKMTLKRSVWIRALRTLCLLKGAPLCSFSFETISAAQAEKYTLRPYRFLANIRSPTPTLLRNIELSDRTSRDEPSAWEDEEEAVLNGFCVVPGGRFAISVNQERRLSVWDLGDAAKEDAQPILMSSVGIGGYASTDSDELKIILLDAQSNIRVVLKYCASPADAQKEWLHEHRFIDIDLNIRDGRHSEKPLLGNVFSRPPSPSAGTLLDFSTISYLQRLSLAPRAHYAFEIDFERCQIGVRDLVRDIQGVIEIDRSFAHAFELQPPATYREEVNFVVGNEASSNRVLVHMLAQRNTELIAFSYDVSLFASLGDAQTFRIRAAHKVTRIEHSLGDADGSILAYAVQESSQHVAISGFVSPRGGIIHFPVPPVSTPDSSSAAAIGGARSCRLDATYSNPRMHTPVMLAGHLLGFNFEDETEKLDISVARYGDMEGSAVDHSYEVAAPMDDWHADCCTLFVSLDVWRGALYLVVGWSAENILVRVFEFTEPV